MRSALAVPVLVAFLFLGAVATSPAAVSASTPEERMVAEINQWRRAYHRPALAPSPSLRRSSRRYAVWMMRRDWFGHRARVAASRSFRSVGENLAWHRGWSLAVGGAVRGWLRSPPHRAVLLSRAYRWVGVGRSRGRFGRPLATMWVLHVGGR